MTTHLANSVRVRLRLSLANMMSIVVGIAEGSDHREGIGDDSRVSAAISNSIGPGKTGIDLADGVGVGVSHGSGDGQECLKEAKSAWPRPGAPDGCQGGVNAISDAWPEGWGNLAQASSAWP